MILLNMHGGGILVGFKKFTEFEQALSKYTGSPHVVLTDCCTHAIELCLRLQGIGIATIPYRSYLSIPMTLHKLNIDYQFDTEIEWEYEYLSLIAEAILSTSLVELQIDYEVLKISATCLLMSMVLCQVRTLNRKLRTQLSGAPPAYY